MHCHMRAFSSKCGVSLDMFDLYSIGLAIVVADTTKHWTDGALVLLAYGAVKSHLNSHNRRNAHDTHIIGVEQDDGQPAYNVSPSNVPPEYRADRFPPIGADEMSLFPRPRMPSAGLPFSTLGYSPSNQALPWYARQVRTPTIQWHQRMNFANTARYN
jgi:hypothetical protein